LTKEEDIANSYPPEEQIDKDYFKWLQEQPDELRLQELGAIRDEKLIVFGRGSKYVPSTGGGERESPIPWLFIGSEGWILNWDRVNQKPSKKEEAKEFLLKVEQVEQPKVQPKSSLEDTVLEVIKKGKGTAENILALREQFDVTSQKIADVMQALMDMGAIVKEGNKFVAVGGK